MSNFKVGDEVVVRRDSRFYAQRKYGKAVIESVLSVGGPWDVFVCYDSGVRRFYKFHDLDKVVKFRVNK